MLNAIANWNRLAACGNSAGNRSQPFPIHPLQWLRQRKQRRALPGGNHAEGYSGGAHRTDVTRRGSSRLSRWFSPCRSRHRTIDPQCLENPRPAGAESTLTENARSPFHAEPRHFEPWQQHQSPVCFLTICAFTGSNIFAAELPCLPQAHTPAIILSEQAPTSSHRCGHPERSLARFLRQGEAKDLRLFLS